MDKKKHLIELEAKLSEYKKKYAEAARRFRGVKHEDSLSELRYTQYMVYKNLVQGLEKEINELKSQGGRSGK